MGLSNRKHALYTELLCSLANSEESVVKRLSIDYKLSFPLHYQWTQTGLLLLTNCDISALALM